MRLIEAVLCVSMLERSTKSYVCGCVGMNGCQLDSLTLIFFSFPLLFLLHEKCGYFWKHELVIISHFFLLPSSTWYFERFIFSWVFNLILYFHLKNCNKILFYSFQLLILNLWILNLSIVNTSCIGFCNLYVLYVVLCVVTASASWSWSLQGGGLPLQSAWNLWLRIFRA